MSVVSYLAAFTAIGIIKMGGPAAANSLVVFAREAMTLQPNKGSAIRTGTVLRPGATIRTGASGTARLLLAGDILVDLGPASTLTLNRRKGHHTKLFLQKGRVRARSFSPATKVILLLKGIRWALNARGKSDFMATLKKRQKVLLFRGRASLAPHDAALPLAREPKRSGSRLSLQASHQIIFDKGRPKLIKVKVKTLARAWKPITPPWPAVPIVAVAHRTGLDVQDARKAADSARMARGGKQGSLSTADGAMCLDGTSGGGAGEIGDNTGTGTEIDRTVTRIKVTVKVPK